MIVATSFGLFMPALRPDYATLPPDAPELQVRARRRVDLDRLRRYMTERNLELGPTIALPHTDYQYRAYTTRATWGLALAAIAMDIDYVKFKDTPAKYHRDHKLTAAYNRVWSALFDSFPSGSVYARPARKGRAAASRQDDLWAGFESE